jgi:hypothetical protein
MKPDDELEEWRRHWHAQPSVPMDLFRRVERGTQYMRRYRIAEILATIFIGGGTVVAAFLFTRPSTILLATGTWIFIALAWTFSLRHTRGIWAPGAPTTAAYVDLSIRRCEWRMKDALYDCAQVVFLTLFVLVIDYHLIIDISGNNPPLRLLVAAFVVIVAAALPIFVRNHRKAQAELTYLLNLQRQLEDHSDSTFR